MYFFNERPYIQNLTKHGNIEFHFSLTTLCEKSRFYITYKIINCFCPCAIKILFNENLSMFEQIKQKQKQKESQQ